MYNHLGSSYIILMTVSLFMSMYLTVVGKLITNLKYTLLMTNQFYI